MTAAIRFPIRLDISAIVLLPPLRAVPHLQEHNGKAFHRIAFHFDCSIFPMPEFHFFINIFICQIHPTGVGHTPIDYQNLPVVPVVLGCRHQGPYRGEHFGFNSHRPKLFRIRIWKQKDGTHAVIHKTDFYSFFHFPL